MPAAVCCVALATGRTSTWRTAGRLHRDRKKSRKGLDTASSCGILAAEYFAAQSILQRQTVADMATKTSVSGARTAPGAPVSGFPGLGRRGSQALLDCLSVVDGADSLFLLRHTGLAASDLDSHLSGLAARGYVAPMATGPERLRPLLGLTDKGRGARETIRRWRFKSAALVFLSALSRR